MIGVFISTSWASSLLMVTEPISTRSPKNGNRRLRGRTRTVRTSPHTGTQSGCPAGGATAHDRMARTIGWLVTQQKVLRIGATTLTAW